MRLKFWKKRVILSPITRKKVDNMKVRITTDTVQSANERLKRDGNRIYSTSHVSNGSFNVSVKYRGDTISQSISSEKIKSDYGRSLKAISDAKKL